MTDITIWAEKGDDGLRDVSLEVLQKALDLSPLYEGRVSAVLIGENCGALAEELVEYGASRVFAVEDSRLRLYQSEAYAKVLTGVLEEIKPEIVLIGGTTIGMDLAPAVAARLRTGLTAHCVDLHVEKIDGRDQLVQIVPGWGGNMMIRIICPEHRPQMVTVRPGVMEKGKRDPRKKGEIFFVKPELSEDDFRARSMEYVREQQGEGSLEDADIIVSGGFGLYSAGGFGLVRELAEAVGGEVAGTRPAFDEGWIPEIAMIGQSGKTVRPKLFISLGASGAVHYTTGFQKSRVIVAVDKNPKAPIFSVADLGVVGDLKRIVPALIEALQKGRSS
ncbi:MAG TPA: electron transfer flavoprotein subunit alpha/FixB family protein [Syntrophales bacterium]|nr:electron transfer flavoprotein subunit alpha/FixB family protein [Syntrophales bacterium]HPI58223.1 electron transfer flavoprotein subunit alpha/FixB family protein [Syntrophales bacterium]HPN25589.1 electron transfer flavoprotein subunit alpha/FixB family protein [Syntrophales bacterium]HQM28153.1 electron transfer flavoprotein subunit alpha/FixB family protein [Syntrophales bacterium]